MQNWKKDRNFRKFKNEDGSFKYIITVDGADVEVSEEIFMEYSRAAYKMEHMEFSIKNDRYVKDKHGHVLKDAQGQALMQPEREVSLDKMISEDWDFAANEALPEDSMIERMEIVQLHACLALLDEAEQNLIDALYFKGLTIREYADSTGKSKSSLDRLKEKILDKLKIFLIS